MTSVQQSTLKKCKVEQFLLFFSQKIIEKKKLKANASEEMRTNMGRRP